MWGIPDSVKLSECHYVRSIHLTVTLTYTLFLPGKDVLGANQKFPLKL